ncbi:Group II intron-encoded protein LtrA [termite gut metagenome]|uniref:Group II intron-encoded protein LtrA n=1 Tax=termite gut metagenome TaxID=433724 RepID=A0A5J4QVC1_9ZZZZ
MQTSYRNTQPFLVAGLGKRTCYGTAAISRKGRKSYPTIYRANSYYVSKRGLPIPECRKAMGIALNIRSGNRASVVVRARESLVHGKGRQLIFLIRLTENVRDMKRSPEKVLNSLMEHSKISDYKYERLYRILFNEEMFYVAWQNIYAKQGNMTKGTDGKTADQMNLHRIERLIETLKDETYQPQPARRVYIPKKNGKKRPLGIPSFDDKLVQEVIRMILEAIYEGYFEYSSHGFRPNKSCHTALTHIQNSFTGTKWFIEGDIKGFFDNINHEVLINTLKERITDERFIRLIRKFLNAGYVEDWKFHKTYSGTPQGGIISPILANIYLDKFDKYMEEYAQSFDKGEKRHRSTEARRFEKKKRSLNMKLKVETDENVWKELIKAIREVEKERAKYPHGDDMDENWRRLKYTRYADDFLIGVIGSKAECIQIKADIAQYMSSKLKLELSDEKTLITNAQKPAKFLGYDTFIRKTNDTKRDMFGNPVRMFNNKIVLYVTTEVMKKKLMEYDAVEFDYSTGKEVWKSKARSYMKNNDMLSILTQYNAEIRGFYNYYSIANNSPVIDSFYNIMEYSMYKTFACKLESSVSKVLTKYYKNKQFAIPYTDSKGQVKYRTFYDEGFKRKTAKRESFYDIIPQTIKCKYPSLTERLRDKTCELCGAEGEITMFQVRNLNALKGKTDWERVMLKRHRKTLAVCSTCNKRIHNEH